MRVSACACVLEHMDIWQGTHEHLAEWNPSSDGLCRSILAGTNGHPTDLGQCMMLKSK